ncbi:MAG: epimerase [Planctomycetota bacterium]|nr:MAG: epimerase [Planctomycetota bacterium]
MKILVTGGAGFIGSHLIDYLISRQHYVVCVDDLSMGRLEHIRHHLQNSHFEFFELDILNGAELNQVFSSGKFQCVFHMAANSDIPAGVQNMNLDLQKTFLTTHCVLECMKNNGVKDLVFASSSAIYGKSYEPLAEGDGPLRPVSFYGAAKLASEAYISAACEVHDLRAWIIRFPNVVGERATHGVVFDFINKLRQNPGRLLILGDGKQQKPYLYVKDLIESILFVWNNSSGDLNCFNIAPSDSVTVTQIAEIVVGEMGLGDVEFSYTGQDRGWPGDVPRFEYDVGKINALGWKAPTTSAQAVKIAVKAQLREISCATTSGNNCRW